MISHYSTQPPNVKLKCLVLGASAAGKTSIIRRYFYNAFDAGRRVPTVGSDWYITRLTNPLHNDEDGQDETSSTNDEVSVSLQVWDTPGREQFDAKRPKQPKQQQQRSPGASFLQQADAIMLVYDVTSSTSFKQLLKWYADLVGLLEKRKPAIVVANKLDLLLAGKQQRAPSNALQKVKQRDVLGLGGNFKGKDFRYEYEVSRIDESESPVRHIKKNGGTSIEFSSYLVDRENWTTDGSYLHSLITSEVSIFTKGAKDNLS